MKRTATITLCNPLGTFPSNRRVFVSYYDTIYFRLEGHKDIEESMINQAKELAMKHGFTHTKVIRKV